MTDQFDIAAGSRTASMVVGETGSAISEHGSSKGLGNQTDLSLLKWFRSRSEIVLTSGKTAEADNYRFPRSTGLAILTRSDRSYQSLGNDKAKVLFLKHLDSYAAAIDELTSLGLSRIHCEFGPSGFVELVKLNLVDGFISSTSKSGIELFAARHDFRLKDLQAVGEDLLVAQVLGRA